MTRLGDDVIGHFTTGQTSVGTSATALASSIIVSRGVTIKADDDNSDSVYVGESSSVSSSNGFRLTAGQALTLQVDDTAKIFIIGGAASQKVHYSAV